MTTSATSAPTAPEIAELVLPPIMNPCTAPNAACRAL